MSPQATAGAHPLASGFQTSIDQGNSERHGVIGEGTVWFRTLGLLCPPLQAIEECKAACEPAGAEFGDKPRIFDLPGRQVDNLAAFTVGLCALSGEHHENAGKVILGATLCARPNLLHDPKPVFRQRIFRLEFEQRRQEVGQPRPVTDPRLQLGEADLPPILIPDMDPREVIEPPGVLSR